MMLRLTKQFVFEMAHALPGYEGKCRNVHGHSYRLSVTVEGERRQQPGTSSDGMVVDFRLIKEVVDRCVVEPFDHALVLPQAGVSEREATVADAVPVQSSLGGYEAKLMLADFQPTTENLLLHFARLLEGQFPEGTRLYSLSLSETDTSTAELIL